MANKLFNRPAPVKDPDILQSGVYLINAETKTFGFDVKVAKQGGRNEKLSREDREHMLKQKPALKNWELAARAKEVWADGASNKQIAEKCRCSLSYAKKLSMCFGRAAFGSKFKKMPAKSSR